jgi:hypothetical protein
VLARVVGLLLDNLHDHTAHSERHVAAAHQFLADVVLQLDVVPPP